MDYETTRTCPRCGQTYTGGTYREHRKAHVDLRVGRTNREQRHWKPQRNAKVVAAVVGPPRRTMEDVGREFGVTRERVRQLMNRAGVDVKTLPPIEHPPRPIPMATCLVCGEEYVDGQYDAHFRAKGHLRAIMPHTLDPKLVAKAMARLDSGATYREVSKQLGIPLANLAVLRRESGHVGYGWRPEKVERNLEIVHRYVDLHQPATRISAEMGINRSTVFNVIRAWRALGERMLPNSDARRDAIERRREAVAHTKET